MLRGSLPGHDRRLALAGFRVVNRQQLRLRLGRVAESLGQHAGDRAVQRAAATEAVEAARRLRTRVYELEAHLAHAPDLTPRASCKSLGLSGTYSSGAGGDGRAVADAATVLSSC